MKQHIIVVSTLVLRSPKGKHTFRARVSPTAITQEGGMPLGAHFGNMEVVETVWDALLVFRFLALGAVFGFNELMLGEPLLKNWREGVWALEREARDKHHIQIEFEERNL